MHQPLDMTIEDEGLVQEASEVVVGQEVRDQLTTFKVLLVEVVEWPLEHRPELPTGVDDGADAVVGNTQELKIRWRQKLLDCWRSRRSHQLLEQR